ncbi:DUF485 domain-containing protein [Quadrisphaera sp. DSM 44207]|uniref:DUF485 domain-containing protein n=1 Tax=Quadrisphaera sp. DSM 44207 TaxID=1881057 RepID=UPI0008826931|nr:DUF485 domain-containing protein [Quadrisphaera sp. DSM 44207]SDQ17829.1 Uncharacterized membrane protein, DUF485 family [Quadrisphaera sp. DSM 44207]
MSVENRVGAVPAGEPPGRATAFEEVHGSCEFEALKRSFRRVIFPATAVFLAWYFLYVLLAAFAQDFMATRLIGNINVGLVFGLLQFVSTFAITMAYRRWADRTYDPAATALRERIEGGTAAGGHR